MAAPEGGIVRAREAGVARASEAFVATATSQAIAPEKITHGAIQGAVRGGCTLESDLTPFLVP